MFIIMGNFKGKIHLQLRKIGLEITPILFNIIYLNLFYEESLLLQPDQAEEYIVKLNQP